VESKKEIRKERKRRKWKINEGRKKNHLIHLHMQLAEKKAGRQVGRQEGKQAGRKEGRKAGRIECRQAGRKKRRQVKLKSLR
jgi:flagellar biosynthesis/type III secretory pathway protein FliH